MKAVYLLWCGLFAAASMSFCQLAVAANPLTLWKSAAPAKGTVTLKGVDGELRDNIQAWLSLEQEPCDAPDWRMQAGLKKADQAIRQSLQAFGYYQPDITQTFQPTAKNGCWNVTFDIQPGTRVTVRNVDVDILGEAGSDDSFQKLIGKTDLKAGQALRHDHYESLKTRITNLAAERGYFDSRFTRRELRVDPAAGYADVDLHFDSGPRFHFGETRLQQDIIDDALLRRYLAYREGQPYTRAALTETSRALSSSGYFAQVLVQPLIDEAQDLEVPVRTTLTPADRHRYTASIGYATDTGPRLGLGYKNVRLNRSGHQLSSDLSLSQVISKLTVGYTIPLEKPVTDKLRFEAGYKREDNDSYEADTTAVSATRTHMLDNQWLQEEALAFGQETYKLSGEERKSTVLLMPGIGWSRTFADNHLYPRKGLSLNFKTRGSLQEVVSDVTFVQLIGGAKGVLGLPWRSRVISRVDGGVTFMNQFEELPPSVRFFTGGDSSVRGYAYKSLGPENNSGDVVGGKNLLVGSLELEHMVAEKWGVAAFVDSGNAFDELRLDPQTGVGLGIRWRSPVGPIRLDIAHPLDKDSDLFRVHFTMGPDL
jgi:translocation and assembly module TamA